MAKRMRLRMHSTILRVTYDTRPKAYMDLRFWWLHELRRLRAARRQGTASRRDIKVAQKELARLRKEYLQQPRHIERGAGGIGGRSPT